MGNLPSIFMTSPKEITKTWNLFKKDDGEVLQHAPWCVCVAEWATTSGNHSPNSATLEIPCLCLVVEQGHFDTSPWSRGVCTCILLHPETSAPPEKLLLLFLCSLVLKALRSSNCFQLFPFFTCSLAGIVFYWFCLSRLPPSPLLTLSTALTLVHSMTTTKWECPGPSLQVMLSIINTTHGAF